MRQVSFENQRYYPWPVKWSAKLLPTDRKAWSDEQGLCDDSRFGMLTHYMLKRGWCPFPFLQMLASLQLVYVLVAIFGCVAGTAMHVVRQAAGENCGSARVDVGWRVDDGLWARGRRGLGVRRELRPQLASIIRCVTAAAVQALYMRVYVWFYVG